MCLLFHYTLDIILFLFLFLIVEKRAQVEQSSLRNKIEQVVIAEMGHDLPYAKFPTPNWTEVEKSMLLYFRNIFKVLIYYFIIKICA